MIHLHACNLTNEELNILSEVDNFFDIEVDIWFKLRKRTAYAGICYCEQRRIDIIVNCNHIGSMMDTILHELGHLYHYTYSRDDFNKCTEYGRELYAEDFKAMVLLNDNDVVTHSEYFKGYTGIGRKRVYTEQFPTISYTDNGRYKYASVQSAKIYIYAHAIKYYDRWGVYNLKYMYTLEINYDGMCIVMDKPTKLDTAKKNVIRQLRKLGVDI